MVWDTWVIHRSPRRNGPGPRTVSASRTTAPRRAGRVPRIAQRLRVQTQAIESAERPAEDCATSEVIPTDTYMISQTSAGAVFTNMSALKSEVIKRANAFAESKGKVAIPLASNTTQGI
jgi:hypothetical protein